MPRKNLLHVDLLEDRIAPAELLHSLFPDPTGPQDVAGFGNSVATSSDYRVVGAPYSDILGLGDAGQVFVYNAGSNTLVATLNNPNPANNDRFGSSVSVSGKYVVVGAWEDDMGASDAGSAYVYDLTSLTPTVPFAILNNPDPFESDSFGCSVSVSGNYVVVGASYDNASKGDAGSAYVYDLTSITPDVPIATLSKPSPVGGDNFGLSVSVSGKYVVVGAWLDVTGTIEGGGSAYVFDLTSMTPTVPIATLNNPTPAESDNYGWSVSVSDNYVVIGAWLDDTGASDAGSAYVYNLTSMTPSVPIVTLNNPSPGSDDWFGFSVSVSGKYVVVGAQGDNSFAGSAYVYDLTSMTPSTPVITLNNPSPLVDGSLFGSAVSVSGTSVIVGDWGAFDANIGAGLAFVYALTSTTPSVPIATLHNPCPASGDYFGYSVSMSGNYVVVGAFRDDTGANEAGAVYVYDLTSMNPGVPIATLTNPSPAAGDQFGNSVSVSGKYVVVGAYADDTGASESGSAYVYDLTSMTPNVPIVTLNNPSPAPDDGFGISVSVSGNYVVVGAWYDDTGASDSGSAYVYDLTSMTPSAPIATMQNPSPAVGDSFGYSVSVSGNYVVVGAFWDNTGATHAGSAYIYNLTSMTPSVPVATLNNPSPAVNDVFGGLVSVSGTLVVVGAFRDDTGANDAGSAYVYNLTSMTPSVPIATLNNPSPASDDWFGFSVSISGKYVVVGAAFDDAGGNDAGSAYVYDLTSMIPNVPIATLNKPTPAAFDGLGYSVSVSGTTVVAGVWQDSDQNADQGSARVYTLAPTRVANLQINSGSVQRSRVTSLAVTFDQPITFTGTPATAFELKRQSDGMTVTLDATLTGNTVTLTFTGGAVDFDSLADGRYTLTIDASQVFNSNGQLDGNGDGIAGDNYVLIGSPANGLYRLFGDADGNGSVTAADFNAFRLAYGSFGPSIFDFDGDNQVSASDFNQFRTRYGITLVP